MPAASSMASAKSREGLIQRAAQSEADYLTPKNEFKKKRRQFFVVHLKKGATNVNVRDW